jgi:branched-chain amino acid transport system ATP-binding protein
MKDLLSIEQVSVARGGRTVLHEVDLSVGPGELVALLGPNGSGKSTLALAAIAALPLELGSISMSGVRIDKTSPDRARREGLILVPEGHRVLGQLSLLENLEVSAAYLRRPSAKNAVERALELFPELKDRLNVAASALSGGQKQMVALAQAFIGNPKVLIVDELSLGLAPVVTRRLIKTLLQMKAEGAAILLVEQFTSLALEVADRAYLLSRGRVVFDGAAIQLVEQPELLHQAYLASEANPAHAAA